MIFREVLDRTRSQSFAHLDTKHHGAITLVCVVVHRNFLLIFALTWPSSSGDLGMEAGETGSVEQPRQGELPGQRVGIRRDGKTVQISLTSASEYDAIELYERLVQGLQGGALRLNIGNANC